MRAAPALTGTTLWLLWVLASAAAGSVGLALGDFPSGVGVLRGSDFSDVSGWTEGWAVVVGGVAAGTVVGMTQWLVVRREFGRPRGWRRANIVGFAVAYAVVWGMGGSGGSSEYAHHALPHVLDRAGTPGGAVFGLIVGLAQWLVLPGRLPLAAWWVPASAAGFLLGWLAAVAVPADGPAAHFVGGLAFGAVFGAVTGTALVWLAGGRAFAGRTTSVNSRQETSVTKLVDTP